MAEGRYRYLLPEDMRRMASFEFAARAMAEGHMTGRHRSRQRGSSIEFHEFRAYSPGDDPALVDWRVFARTDRHYLKTFEQETNLECHILLDSSASMGFMGNAKYSKLDFASFFAACLSWLVVLQNDRVSLMTFDKGIRAFHPPASTRTHLHGVLNALEHNEPGSPTSLCETLRRAEPNFKRKGTLVVLSDFWEEPAAIFQALNPWLHRGFRIHLFHVLSPQEITLPDEGLVRYQDMEDREVLMLHTRQIATEYAEAMKKRIANFRAYAAKRQVDYALAPTDQPYLKLFDHVT